MNIKIKDTFLFCDQYIQNLVQYSHQCCHYYWTPHSSFFWHHLIQFTYNFCSGVTIENSGICSILIFFVHLIWIKTIYLQCFMATMVDFLLIKADGIIIIFKGVKSSLVHQIFFLWKVQISNKPTFLQYVVSLQSSAMNFSRQHILCCVFSIAFIHCF